MSARILPAALVQAVEMYVDDSLARAAKYENAELLDESEVFTLHRLAASIYAAGWEDGERAEAERQSGQRRRRADREKL